MSAESSFIFLLWEARVWVCDDGVILHKCVLPDTGSLCNVQPCCKVSQLKAIQMSKCNHCAYGSIWYFLGAKVAFGRYIRNTNLHSFLWL